MQPHPVTADPRAEMERIRVTGYDVVIAPGMLGAPELGALVREHAPAHRYVIITDNVVGPHYASPVAAALGGSPLVLTVPSGEEEKNRARWAELTDAMLAAGVGRDGAVLALGGGVIGDLAGFVAATYMRGVPCVQLPTSLLAMVDASVGGKTAVDTPAGKNLVGILHRPALVVIDPRCLATLDRRQIAAGYAEVIKHGAIADERYFDRAAHSAPAFGQQRDTGHGSAVIRRSVEIKAAIVERDEYERGERRTLNFGHTVGHAIEAVSGFALLHGEAVAIGMVVEARCGELLDVTAPGTAERLRAAVQAAGLPWLVPPQLSHESILAATRSDKKAARGDVRHALPERIGAMHRADGEWVLPVPDVVLLDALAARPAD